MDDQRAAELRKLGMPEAEIAAFLAAERVDTGEGEDEEDDGPVIVWPQNWGVVRLFLDLEGSWRVSPGGEPQGLRYGDAIATIGLLWDDRDEQRRVYHELVDMQREALRAWGEGAAR